MSGLARNQMRGARMGGAITSAKYAAKSANSSRAIAQRIMSVGRARSREPTGLTPESNKKPSIGTQLPAASRGGSI